ncbi:hypothetical protein SPFL3102_03238 [Sporomusaceae bacterium FL31]|nr:hypothetical protein SPFL3101_00833 [Sporomusaceae bacterium FL31]GCE35402.1 hypothetical protein SPFL3102_03238 [Sporomusaceae bacterium]
MQIKAVVDRFEHDKAILMVGEAAVVWPKITLPSAVKEGDHLKIQIEIDKKATADARQEAEELLKSLLEDNRNC